MTGIFKKAIASVYPPRHLAFYLQRRVKTPTRRAAVSNWIAGRLPRTEDKILSPEQERELSALKADGYTPVSRLLTPQDIIEMRDFLRPLECYDRFRPAAGRFRVEKAPSSCHVAVYPDEVALRCPHVLRIANSPEVIAVVGALLGCKPTISNLGIWWSLPGHQHSEDAELFHRDVDDWHFVKLFVYLTDVDAETGPHVYVAGSHRDPRLLKIRRYQDDEVTRVFGQDRIRIFTGPEGTAFLENTFGLHKGLTAVSRPRLLFQVQYSLLPIGIYEYTVKTNIGTADPYTNRLYSA